MLWLAENKDEVGIVADQFGNPTYALEIARTLLDVSRQILEQGWQKKFGGIFHLTGTGDTSWHGFASEIFRQAHASGSYPMPHTINALTTADYPTPATRPANSRLNCDKLDDTFGIRLPNWQGSLADCLNRLEGQER